MTESQFDLICFTLGIVGNRKNPSRNAIATGPEEKTWNDVQDLENHGFLFKGAKIPGKLSYYHASTAGIAVAKLTWEEVNELSRCLYPSLLEVGPVPQGPPDISGDEAPPPDLSGDPSETGDSQEYETEVAATPPPERPAPKRKPKAKPKPEPEPEPEDQTQELAYMEE